MFFNDVSEILKISRCTSCAIFILPDDEFLEIPGALVLKPVEKSVITIEQVRDVIKRLNVRQLKDQYIIIRPAEALGEEAANAFLKNLEEPQEKVHFILVTSEPSRLLPTVLSRSAIYFLRTNSKLDGEIKVDANVKALAKRLLVAKPVDLPVLVDEICKKKDGVRQFSLLVLATAIEMLYKSYFITGKDVFVKKIPKFMTAYENIEKNGHIKLHLVADLC